MERFLGVLIEHYGGAFPVWLAPVQAVVIPIADRHLEYAESVLTTLEGAGFRAEVDSRNERMNQKSAPPNCKRCHICWSSATGRRRPTL